MNQQEQLSARERSVNWLNTTLARYGKVIVTAGIALIVIIAGIVIYYQVQERRLQDSIVIVEEAEELIEQWEMSGEDEREALESQFLPLLEEVIEGYSNLYSAQRALYLRGQFYMDTEAWEQAISDYRELSDSFPDSHLALIALSNKAAAHEELGETDRALETFEELSEKREARNPLRARAMFSIGRILERTGPHEAAVDAYEELVAEFSNSEWTNLARNRILVIETGHAGN